jgi:uracil-DNA glycosylase
MTDRRTTDSLLTVLPKVRSWLCADQLPEGLRPLLQFGRGAKMLVAGQGPGRRAQKSGVPFNDPSDDRLRKWMGIGRATFYDSTTLALIPMGFCYPGTGRTGDLSPRSECAGKCR